LSKEKTMTREPLSLRRRKPFQPAHRDHIPHPSWSRTDRPSSGETALAPEDFWSRLGL
jgi:hypothetical protein